MDLRENVKGWVVGYETSVDKPAGDNGDNDGHVHDDEPASLLEVSGGSATAALMAGAVATYPYWMPLLGGKRRKKRFVQRFGRGGNPEISSDWLALLTGAKYAGNSDDSEKRVDNWTTKIKDPALEVDGSDDVLQILR